MLARTARRGGVARDECQSNESDFDVCSPKLSQLRASGLVDYAKGRILREPERTDRQRCGPVGLPSVGQNRAFVVRGLMHYGARNRRAYRSPWNVKPYSQEAKGSGPPGQQATKMSWS